MKINQLSDAPCVADLWDCRQSRQRFSRPWPWPEARRRDQPMRQVWKRNPSQVLAAAIQDPAGHCQLVDRIDRALVGLSKSAA
ncbi:hypothetical protein [Sphaerotilus montanus]|uniref:hypothetical protein n=1 Tax=Sphaerotilus montanus TaxID=522889 RepID=UPI003FA22738